MTTLLPSRSETWRLFVSVTALLLVLLQGCGRDDRDGDRATLRVAAAASTRPAMERIADEYRELHPELDLSITYGASGNFHAQILQGAPFDIFFSADDFYPADLARRLGIETEPFRYAGGRIVIWVPEDSPLEIERGLEGLVEPRARQIAIANPELAPYGEAAVQAVERAGLREHLTPRLVRATNIVEALQFAQSGAADAGIVALSLIRAPNLGGEGRSFTIPAAMHEPIVQEGLVLPGARADAAARFRDFVLSERGRDILEELGFEPPAD